MVNTYESAAATYKMVHDIPIKQDLLSTNGLEFIDNPKTLTTLNRRRDIRLLLAITIGFLGSFGLIMGGLSLISEVVDIGLERGVFLAVIIGLSIVVTALFVIGLILLPRVVNATLFGNPMQDYISENVNALERYTQALLEDHHKTRDITLTKFTAKHSTSNQDGICLTADYTTNASEASQTVEVLLELNARRPLLSVKTFKVSPHIEK